MRSALIAAFLVVMSVARAWAQPPVIGWQRGLTPKAPPTRVVSLAPSTTEMLFELGLGDRVVGVTRYCDRPAAALALPKIGGFSDPSLEAVMALKPGAVVTVPSEANQKVVQRLTDLGVPVLLLPGTTLPDVHEALTLMGRELGAVEKAAEVSQRIRARIKMVEEKVAGRPRPRVLILYDHRPMIVAGPGSFASEVLPLAGGINVVTQGQVAYPTLSLETVARLKPDVVVDASMGAQGADTGATMELLGRLSSIPAVAHKRVVVLPSNMLMRPGTSLGEDVEALARLLHPDAFAPR
jgi:iron complex transport system substrate-binding protein